MRVVVGRQPNLCRSMLVAATLWSCGGGENPTTRAPADARPAGDTGAGGGGGAGGTVAGGVTPDARATSDARAMDALPPADARPGDALASTDARPTDATSSPPPPERPLPVPGQPSVRHDGCLAYTCEVFVPEGHTAAWAWRLDGRVLPERGADGLELARHGPRLDLTQVPQGAGALTCSVRFADERGFFGPAETSGPLNVVRPIPTLATALLSPEEPVRGEPLTCLAGGLRFADCPADDVRTEYRFTVDGQDVPGDGGAVLDASLSPGTQVQCLATPVGPGGDRGPTVGSDGVSIARVEPGALSVQVLATGDPAAPARCAVVGDAVVPPGTVFWWEINDRAPFPGDERLGDAQVGDCDRLQCFAVLPDGRRSLRAELRLPLGPDCALADACAAPACAPEGGCGRSLTGGAPCPGGPCGGVGRCAEGRCVAPVAPCDDGVPCTVDTCGEDGQCAHSPADAVACDDGDACTQGDRCAAGACHGRQLCGCQENADCDDGDPCTAERCEAGACAYPAAEGDCSDGDPCTGQDRCVEGLCRGEPEPCVAVFEDTDGDGFGADPPEGAPVRCGCRETGPGLVDAAGDCDDTAAAVNPDADDQPDDGVDSDCDGLEQIGGRPVAVAPEAGEVPAAPGEPVPLAGEFDFGPLGTHEAQGEATRSADGSGWCLASPMFQAFDEQLTLEGAIVEVCQDADGHRTSTVVGAARIAGIPVTVDGSLSLVAPFDYHLELSGDFDFRGVGLPLLVGRSRAERVEGALNWGFEARASGFPLAPGFELEEVVLTVGPSGVNVAAHVRLGDGERALRLIVGGLVAYDGTGEITLGLPENTTWTPLGAAVPLGTLADLTGTLRFGAGGSVSAAFRAGLAGELRLFNALTLRALAFTGEVDDTGHFAIGLEAETDFDLGEVEPVTVQLAGTLEDGQVFALEGFIDGAVDPLSKTPSRGALVLEATEARPFGVTFSVDLAARSVSGSISVPATFNLPGLGELTAYVYAEGTFARGAIAWLFQAIVEDLTLPVLGQMPTVAIVASTEDARDVDLFRDGSTFRDVPAGVTLAAAGDLPFELQGAPPQVLMILQVVPAEAKLIVSADLGLSLDIIQPAMGLPGIARLTLTRVALVGEFGASGAQLGIESELEMLPDDQASVLHGFTALEYTPPSDFGGTLALTGLWLEPMGLRSFGIQNPAFTVAATISPALGIPVVTRLGWNLDLFWKKSGTWPRALPPEVETAPENVLAVGSTFLFDKEPSPSGLCILGICPPLPPFAVRFNFENLSTADIIAVVNDVVRGLLSFFPDALPEGELEVPDLAPFELTARTMRFEASTHEMDFFGQPLRAGVRALMDGSLNGVNARFEGRLDPDGLLISGNVDAMEIEPYFSLAGDTFQRELRGFSSRTLPAADLRMNPGTLEGVFEYAAACNVEVPLFTRRGATGASLALGPCTDDARPLVARLVGGATRTLTTAPVAPVGGRAHFALQLEGADVGLYLDGARLAAVSDTAPAMAAGAPTDWIVGGAGVRAVDDVRVFDGARRSSAEIGAQARRLPTRSLNAGGGFPDSPLQRAYEFDFDPVTSSARNAREGLANRPLTGPADGALERPRENPIQFVVDVPNPLSDLRAPAFGIQAGVDIDLPLLPVGGLRGTLDGELGEGAQRVRFRAAPFRLLEIPTLGAFVVSGNGRNLVDDGGGYDDGMYGELDLGEAYFSGSAAFEWRGEDGSVQKFLAGSAVLDVPNEYFAMAADIDWSVNPGCGATGVVGSARYNELEGDTTPTNPPTLEVEGTATLCGQAFADVSMSLSGNELRFEQGWRWGLDIPGAPIEVPAGLAGATTRYTMNFREARACGEAEVVANGTTCRAQVCFNRGAATLAMTCEFRCDGGTCGVFGDPLPGLEYCGSPGDALPICHRDCGRCDVAGLCDEDDDCESRNCFGGLCVPSLYCGDGTCGVGGIQVAGVELCGAGDVGDVCQSDCGKCGLGGACDADNDCSVGRCDRTLGVCVPRCGDATCSPGETCGGANAGTTCNADCGLCPDGVPCTDNSTCESRYCVGVCTANPCGNGRCDDIPFVETCGAGNGGPECQTDCGKCSGVAACNSNDDCVSNVCTNGLCESCGDGTCSPVIESCGQGNDGLSCERDCGRCPDWTPCIEHEACSSGYCLGLCQPDPCGDGRCLWLPGVETCGSGNGGDSCETDCGRCEWGGLCDEDRDCYSSNCVEFVCGPPKRNCGDGHCLNLPGLELCGEGNGGDTCQADCGKCGTGGVCDRDGDCSGGNCLNVAEGTPGFCAGCGDGVCTPLIENCGAGQSPGVCERDCGRCGIAGICDEGRDCRSGNCVAGFCVASCGDGTCSIGEFCGGPRNGAACHADCGYCGRGTPCLDSHNCVNNCVFGFCD